MKGSTLRAVLIGIGLLVVASSAAIAQQQQRPTRTPDQRSDLPVPLRGKTSYRPIAIEESFQEIYEPLAAARQQVMRDAMRRLEERYDLSNRPEPGVTMSRGKPVQAGPRVRLPQGVTWEQLAAMSPDEIRSRGLWPKGFIPLPHTNQEQGGMVFPKVHIEAILEQEKRDLNRFDLDFDIPEHFIPEHPPAIYLTTRPDLGDVSQGEVVTTQNFFRLFNGILNPKQLEGLRLLVSQFPQQEFNMTNDRRSEHPHIGVSCFDCHTNGHTNAAFHLVGDIRPQAFRRRIDSPTLRGVNQERLFGSQRALRTVEDFTEFEQRAAYFDGDVVAAKKKGENILERGSEIQAMAEFQEILDFPPAPKLDIFGRLDPALATEQELRGEQLFFGKARCHECHPPPIYSDNFMHDLRADRFHEPVLEAGRMAVRDGAIKTFALRGVKESPPYLHDGRLLTLADAVEFFNLVLQVNLTQQEKQDLLAFLYTL